VEFNLYAKFTQRKAMRSYLKIVFLLIIPVFGLVFFHLEKARLCKKHITSSLVTNQSDISANTDDDSLSDSAFDNDEDNSSESIMRLLSGINSINSIEIPVRVYSSFPISYSISEVYREVSPSFLSVYRI
jgi:hypothetical protein